jgi:hypothetical protein
MRGGAQGQLMLGADGQAYVVKFRNNPQHARVLANEFLAAKLARAVGLTVPEVDLVEVSSWLVEHSPEMVIDLGRRIEPCAAGLQFGSRFAGGMMPGQVIDMMPEEKLAEVRNLGEFAGILALDKWTANANGRQAVYVRNQRQQHYRATFIDFGHCFQAGDWRFDDVPLRGVFFSNLVYRGIAGWDHFEPWLSRIESLPAETVWSAAGEIPPEWYGGEISSMESLVEKLLLRRARVREKIDDFRLSSRNPFPNWGTKGLGAEEKRWPQMGNSAIVGRA